MAATVVVLAAAGCGGEPSSPQAAVPPELARLDGAIMTTTRVVGPAELDDGKLAACGYSGTESPAAVERVTDAGESLTLKAGSSVTACDGIDDPAPDPDMPYDGVWCGSSVGRVEDGKLTDPRLRLCTDKDGALTAFAWVEALPAAKWLVVNNSGVREVYEVVRSLPVRVTTTESVQPAGSASFDLEEYAADGTKLREYTLEAGVAG